MTMKTTIRQFTRDPSSLIGFQSTNRASTDAINALEQWKLSVNGLNFEGRECAGWCEAGVLVQAPEQLARIHAWFEEQWAEGRSSDISDADLDEADLHWKNRRANRVTSTTVKRLLDVPLEQLKDLPIYLVLSNSEASEMACEAGDKVISEVAWSGDETLANRLGFFDNSIDLPRDGALLCFRYGTRLGLTDDRVWERVPRLDAAYHADGRKRQIAMTVRLEDVLGWSYNPADARELARRLKPAMPRIVTLAGEYGGIVMPLYKALSWASPGRLD